MSRINSSELWNYFTKSADLKAICKTCKDSCSYKSTTANLKAHLKRKHLSIYLGLPSVVQNQNNVSPANLTQPSSSVVPVANVTIPSTSTSTAPDAGTTPTIDVEQPESAPSSSAAPVARKRKIQNDMDSYIPKKISKEQKKNIDSDVLALCVDAFHPFSIVEERSFQKLIKWIPGYTLPSRKTLSNSHLNSLYNNTKQKVLDEVATQCDAMCITFDLWTSRKTESYIGITGHYIDKNFELKTVLLDCCHFEGSHTAENIATEIRKVTDEWNVSNKVNFAISDNASNVTNAITCSEAISTHLKWKHYGCYAHKLNLILKEALKIFEHSISKVKRIVAFFKKSTSGTDKLNQQQMANNKTPKRLIQEVETRWNSTYYMLDRFCQLKEEIQITLAILNKNLPIISEEEWSAFTQLCKILKPFEEITAAMSGEKYVTGSHVIVLTRILKDICRRFRFSEDCEHIQHFIDATQSLIEIKIGNVEKSGTFSTCTFLDPRFKVAAFSSHTEAMQIKRKIQDKVQNMIASHVTQERSPEVAVSEDSQKESVWAVFDDFMRSTTTSVPGTPLSKAIKEVQMYLDDDILPRKKSSGEHNCPGQWWRMHQNIYPNLAKIYRLNSNMVGTSVPCERMFSKTGQIVSDRRSSLSTRKVRQLMFLNVNMDQNRFNV